MQHPIEELSTTDLIQVVIDRLRGDQSIGPPVDFRSGQSTFQWLVDCYRSGGDGFRDRFAVVMRDLLPKVVLPDSELNSVRTDYAVLLQCTGTPIVDSILVILRADRSTKLVDGDETRALLLKCLISSGRKQTVKFWRQQQKLVSPEYGAVIFRGLVEHGLDTAMRHLRSVCENDHAARQISVILPSLIDRFGQNAVEESINDRFSELTQAARTCFRHVLPSIKDPPFENSMFYAFRGLVQTSQRTGQIRNRKISDGQIDQLRLALEAIQDRVDMYFEDDTPAPVGATDAQKGDEAVLEQIASVALTVVSAFEGHGLAGFLDMYLRTLFFPLRLRIKADEQFSDRIDQVIQSPDTLNETRFAKFLKESVTRVDNSASSEAQQEDRVF